MNDLLIVTLFPVHVQGLEYGRYLQEVVATLEEDKEFAKKLENASIDHIKSGAIADELHFVDHKVRSKLDELKRIEMERLRKLTTKEKHLKDQIEREGSQNNQGDNDSDRKWRTVGNDGSSSISSSSGISAGTFTTLTLANDTNAWHHCIHTDLIVLITGKISWPLAD